MIKNMPTPTEEEIDAYVSYIKSRKKDFFTIIETETKKKINDPALKIILEFKKTIDAKKNKSNAYYVLAGFLHAWKLLERSHECAAMKEDFEEGEKDKLEAYIEYLERENSELKRQNPDL